MLSNRHRIRVRLMRILERVYNDHYARYKEFTLDNVSGELTRNGLDGRSYTVSLKAMLVTTNVTTVYVTRTVKDIKRSYLKDKRYLSLNMTDDEIYDIIHELFEDEYINSRYVSGNYHQSVYDFMELVDVLYQRDNNLHCIYTGSVENTYSLAIANKKNKHFNRAIQADNFTSLVNGLDALLTKYPIMKSFTLEERVERMFTPVCKPLALNLIYIDKSDSDEDNSKCHRNYKDVEHLEWSVDNPIGEVVVVQDNDGQWRVSGRLFRLDDQWITVSTSEVDEIKHEDQSELYRFMILQYCSKFMAKKMRNVIIENGDTLLLDDMDDLANEAGFIRTLTTHHQGYRYHNGVNIRYIDRYDIEKGFEVVGYKPTISKNNVQLAIINTTNLDEIRNVLMKVNHFVGHPRPYYHFQDGDWVKVEPCVNENLTEYRIRVTLKTGDAYASEDAFYPVIDYKNFNEFEEIEIQKYLDIINNDINNNAVGDLPKVYDELLKLKPIQQSI